MTLALPPDSDHLPPGAHPATVDVVKAVFVDGFPGSTTRRAIYSDWLRLRESLAGIITLERQWLDGSYTTKKPDPNDLDLATFADSEEVECLDAVQEAALKALTSGPSDVARRCDSFIIVEYPEGHPLHAVSVSTREGFAEVFFGNGPGGPGTKGFVEVTP